PARPRELRDPAGQGARRLRARDARARRAADRALHARARSVPAVERRHARGGRARRVRDHDRTELGRARDRGADGHRYEHGGGRRDARMTQATASRRDVLRWLAGAPLGAVALRTGVAAAAADAPLHKDARAPVAARVRDLLARMTPEEKVAQMTAIWARKEQVMDVLAFSPEKASRHFPHGIGQVTRPSDKRGGPGGGEASGGSRDRWREPAATVDFINAVQRWATEETRLGIPVLFHEESLHGYMATDATMFPQAIALAGTFDPDLMRRVSAIIAREVRARGVPLVLSPVVDIVRDPRWGRIEATFGE